MSSPPTACAALNIAAWILLTSKSTTSPLRFSTRVNRRLRRGGRGDGLDVVCGCCTSPFSSGTHPPLFRFFNSSRKCSGLSNCR